MFATLFNICVGFFLAMFFANVGPLWPIATALIAGSTAWRSLRPAATTDESSPAPINA